MGLGLGIGVWWPIQTSIIPGLLKLLEARADYFENKTCTTNTLDAIAAVRYTPPPPPGLLLEDYPGAAAAYSLRNLIDTTTSVVRVRRSSDNTEQDFSAAEITDGTLTTFTGANDGFVTTWYDQSGNSNNAVQATASNQPKIVDSGVVILENGKPAVQGDSANVTNLKSGSFNQGTINQPISAFVAGKPSFSNDSIFDADVSGQIFLAGTLANAGTTLLLNIPTVGLQYSLFMLFNSTNSNYYINGNLENTGDVGTNNMQGITLFNRRNATSHNGQNGNIQEIIIYPTDQSTNRTGIEANINTEYTIY